MESAIASPVRPRKSSLLAPDAQPLETIDDPARETERAFTRLVARHGDAIASYLHRLTADRSRAEDLTQETFVRFFERRDLYLEQGQLTAYLYRIATNLLRSEERRRRRWRLLEPLIRPLRTARGPRSAAAPAASPSAVPDPRSLTLAEESRRQVRAAIASLDLVYRAPLVLRELEGLSYREIAEALDCPTGTIKSRLHRARELLKEELAPYWLDPTGSESASGAES